ncbi:MAG: type 1 glutamine amidotransferase [Chitinophagales bacterium]
MSLFCIQQVFFEGPNIIRDWAEERGHSFHLIKMFEAPELPNVDDVDGLVILGGPMNVHDEEEYPWLIKEKQFIRSCFDAGKPILGICLGAQLLAHILGAKVFKNQHKEIGWLPVQLDQSATKHPLFQGLKSDIITFQWHGDTFDLPENAVRIATSEACVNQGFIYKNALALQFHPEMMPHRIKELAHYCGDELIDAPYIQTQEELLDETYVEANHQWLKTVLDRFIE